MVRFKNRYMLLELTWKDGKVDTSVNEAALLVPFRDSLQQMFGDYGLGSALASLQVKYYNPISNLCIIRCSQDEHRQIWASLTVLSEIRNRVVAIRMLVLTGSLAAVKEAAAVAHAAAVVGRHLSDKLSKVADEAADRLKLLEV